MSTPALIRYNGLLLALLATMGIVYLLSAVTFVLLGRGLLVALFTILALVDFVAYRGVKEQRP